MATPAITDKNTGRLTLQVTSQISSQLGVIPIKVIPGNLVYIAKIQISSEPMVTAQFKNFLDRETLRSSIISDDWVIASLGKDIPLHNLVILKESKTRRSLQVLVAYQDLWI